MKSFRKFILAAIALLKSFKRHIIIAVSVLILGLVSIVDSYSTQQKEAKILTSQPTNTSDNFTTGSDTANVATNDDPLTVVRAAPELLASVVAKAGNQASPGGDNSSLLFNTAVIAPRTLVADIPLTPTPIPPSTALLGSGLVALFALRQRKRKTLV